MTKIHKRKRKITRNKKKNSGNDTERITYSYYTYAINFTRIIIFE